MTECSTADFLATAEELRKSGKPADVRAAISRAYYAAFHDLSDKLACMSEDPINDLGKHGKLKHGLVVKNLRAFKTSYPDRKVADRLGNEARSLSQVFVSAMGAREEADYDLREITTLEPFAVVQHFGRIIKLRKFAKKLPTL